MLDDPRITEMHVITLDTQLESRRPASHLDE
jgi:hypothetical protein